MDTFHCPALGGFVWWHNPLRANLGTPDAGVVTGDAGSSKETNLRTATPQVSKVTGQGGGSYDGPTYVDGVSWSSTDGLSAAEPSDAEADAGGGGSETSAIAEGSSNTLWIALGLGGGVLMVVGLVAALLFWRRRTTT